MVFRRALYEERTGVGVGWPVCAHLCMHVFVFYEYSLRVRARCYNNVGVRAQCVIRKGVRMSQETKAGGIPEYNDVAKI